MSSRVMTKHLALLNDKLWDIHPSWVEFAQALPVGNTIIEIIKADSLDKKGNRQKLVDVLVKWKRRGGTRTWKVICDALLKIRRKDVADKIEREHSNLNTNVPFDDDGYVWTMMKTLEPVMLLWDQFALALGLPNTTVLEIKGNASSVNDCFTELIRKWINLKGEEATFDKVLTACERIEYGNLADKLRADKDIQREFFGNLVSLSSKNGAAGHSFSSSIGSGAGLSTINFSALSAWSLNKVHESFNLNGQGTVVAILDTHVDLRCNEFSGKNYPTDIEVVDCLQHIPVSIDLQSALVIGPHEHGTTCASIVVGSSNGIAPGAKLIAYRIAEQGAYNYLEAALRALDDIKERIDKGYRIDVVSISCDLKEDVNDLLYGRISTLISEQYRVTFVAAAGNSGRFHPHSAIPARFDNVISAGALDRHGDKSRITSSGRVDVYAPGEDIPLPSPAGTVDSGTSYACPAIAGLVLLLKQLASEISQPVLRNNIHRVDVLKYIFEVMIIEADNKKDMVFSPLDFFQNMANHQVDLFALLQEKGFLR